MADSSGSQLTLLSIIRHWPVAINIAEYLPAGSLINLARSSVSLRQALHGFEVSSSLELTVTSDVGPHTTTNDPKQVVRPYKDLYLGAHRTPYWEGLKRAARFTCSSRTHTKGTKTRSCLHCSLPVCETCIVKDSFGKKENTHKNRCRFMCKCCWDAGNVRKDRRYSGTSSAADSASYKSQANARQYCTCTGKDNWLCKDCKEKQNMDGEEKGTKVCLGQDCETILEHDKDRRRICLWCDKPVPRAWAIIESKRLFDQIMTEAWVRSVSWDTADFEEYKSNRRRELCVSRREIRGDRMVEDDLDADVLQYVRDLDIFNYQQLCALQPSADDVYSSKHGRWIYRENFLRRFRSKCHRHKDSAFFQKITSRDLADTPPPKTHKDIGIMSCRRELTELVLNQQLDAAFNMAFDPCGDGIHPAQQEEESLSGAEVSRGHLEESTKSQQEGEPNLELTTLDDDYVIVALRETEVEARGDELGSGRRSAAVQPRELPPEYGSDTLVLESGDGMESNPVDRWI